MSFFLNFDGDIPNALVASAIGTQGIPGVPFYRHRLLNGIVIDASTLNQFWIDRMGQKHVIANQSWQLVECSIDDELINDGGNWRIKTQQDVMQDAISNVLSGIDLERNRRWRGGFPVVISGEIKWFHSDEFSLTQHLGLKDKARDLLAAGGLMSDNITIGGQPVAWSTMDGSQVTITAQIAFDMVAAAALQQALIFSASQAHRIAIANIQDPATYDVLTNWPPSFGDPA